MKENRWARVQVATLICCICAAWVIGGCGKKQEEENKDGSGTFVEERTAVELTEAIALPNAGDAISYAWFFASSIVDDPDDKANAQAEVALAELRRGGGAQRALTRAYMIYRWPRSLVLAEAGEELARKGEAGNAAVLVEDAMEVAEKGIEQDWQGSRIREALRRVELMLGANSVGKAASATNALDKLWVEAESGIGLQAWERRMDVVEMALSRGEADYAGAKMAEVAEGVGGVEAPPYMLLPTQARAARLLAETGMKDEARKLADSVVARVPELMNIEQPAVLAEAAAAARLADPGGDAEARFLEAARLSSELVNNRPRCKALASIGLSLDASGMENEKIFAALDVEVRKLAAGL